MIFCRKIFRHCLRLMHSENNSNSIDLTQILQESLTNKSVKPTQRIDPAETNVFLFSGQGSQKVGMADDLLQYPNVNEMFNVASDILEIDLLSTCQNGPQSKLDKTVYCQPAVVITALAGVEKLQSTNPSILENCSCTAGYSVGEYAALVFAGVLTFESAMHLIKVRSRAMQKASDITKSSMITAVGGKNTQFKQACIAAIEYCKSGLTMEDPVCSISAYLSPNVITVAGNIEAINFIRENKAKFGIRKTIPIPVSGAFHTKLMQYAADELRVAVKKTTFQDPLINVYSNLTGKMYHGKKDISKRLPNQVIYPVRWEQTMHSIFLRPEGIAMPTIYDLGPGNQLGTLLRSCNGKAWKKYVPAYKAE
uniref:Malonyl-CoA-acyl carrier protein transacylase, mitochondrial n=1 Tax=Ciona savignyi TaxID=51511 RepID=H2Y8M2_CIOSA